MVESKKNVLGILLTRGTPVASFIFIQLLDAPGHWYAPMLPDDHPSSFCKLTGLALGKLCLVLEALDFIMK
jgi:hypothetical protein